MTTQPSKQPSDHQTDELTAYLDGELTRAETLALESRLATDVTLRRELGQLQKAWDLLDTLPRAKAGETFSTTTMSLAADLLKKETATKQFKPSFSRWAALLAGGLLIFCALAAGYYAVDNIVQRPKVEMESQLHLLSNFATYSHLSENYLGDKNLEFLRLLQSSGLFVAPEVGETTAAQEPKTLDELTADERTEVIRHYQTLTGDPQSATAAKYDSMRSLAAQIGAETSRTSLLRVHERYYAWLQSLPRSEIREIENQREPEARVERIRSTWRRQSRQKLHSMLKDLRVIFTAKDYDIFRNWFCQFVDSHEVQIREQLKGRESQAIRELERITDPDRKCMRLYFIYSWLVGEDKAIVPSQEDFNRLTSLLSDEAKKQLSSIEASEDQRRQMIKALVHAAFSARYAPPPTEEELDEILSELSAVEREKIEHMKAIDQRRELQRRFEEKKQKASPRSNNKDNRGEKRSGPSAREDSPSNDEKP